MVGRRAEGRKGHAERRLRMRSAVAFEKVDCWLLLVEVDGSLRVEILVLDH